jgi:osmoprotectant transport system permease protein
MSVKKRVILVLAVIVFIGVVLIATRTAGKSGPGLRAAFDAEFLTRPDGYPGLSKRYGFKFPSPPQQMDPGLMYRAAGIDEAVDVVDGFATDGRIPAYDLVILEDDKGFFPPYYAAPLIRADTLRKHPELEKILNSLENTIPDTLMQKLNYEVDEKGRKAYDVARQFLVTQKLIKGNAGSGKRSGGSITIGGKQFTEQEILGEIMAILIECNSSIEVKRKLNLGGTMICYNALKAGDLDLYAEYTGTGLVNILKGEPLSDPDETYKTVREAFQREYGLVWLKPFGFNNTYTLTMRRKHAEELGITSISDLAKYLDQNRKKESK